MFLWEWILILPVHSWRSLLLFSLIWDSKWECLINWLASKREVTGLQTLVMKVLCYRLVLSSVVVVVLWLSCVLLFATPWPAALQASMPFIIFQSLLKFMFVESVMPSNHLILYRPLLVLPSIFPSIRVFPLSQLFVSGGQSVGASASASVFPINNQGWFPLDSLVWSPFCPRDSPEPQFKGISTSALSLFYCPNITSTHDYWKNHSFDYTNLCKQSNVSSF